MITALAQRWRSGRASYRPAGEPIRTAEHEIASVADDRTAKAFVVEHHYSGTYPAARRRFGLYRRAALVGIAVFSVPAREASMACIQAPPAERLTLGRFVLLDQVAANGETWFLARCFDLLRREGFAGVVSFADPVARTTARGEVVFPGHLGIIYRAHNARYLGRSKPSTQRLLPDGRVLSPRALAKIRTRDRGWRYAADQLAAAGAAPLSSAEDASAWVDRWLLRVTRPLRHRGNLKYVWALHRAVARQLPPGLPYPSREELAA